MKIVSIAGLTALSLCCVLARPLLMAPLPRRFPLRFFQQPDNKSSETGKELAMNLLAFAQLTGILAALLLLLWVVFRPRTGSSVPDIPASFLIVC